MEENQKEGGKAKPNAKPNIPVGDMDFGTVANDAVAMWKIEPWLTLQYTTQAIAQQKVDLFNTIIGNRRGDGGGRPQYTMALESINLSTYPLNFKGNAFKTKFSTLTTALNNTS